MKLIVGIILCCLCYNVSGKQSTQQKKLESLKSLIFNNAKATVTLNSTDLKQLLSLSRPTLGKGMCFFFSYPTPCRPRLINSFGWLTVRGNVEPYFYFQRTLRTQTGRLVFTFLSNTQDPLGIDRLLNLTISWLTTETDMTTERVCLRVRWREPTCLSSMSC